MGALKDAPGVISKPLRTYVQVMDAMIILGCKKSKASEYIHRANEKAQQSGVEAYTQGKVNKYIFAEMLGIPIDDVNKVIAYNGEKGR